jgi:ankyrin repeat protein
VAYGADKAAQDKSGQTPLFLACEAKHAFCANVLLNAGAPTAVLAEEYSPLHVACEVGAVECVRLLLRWHADTSMRDDTLATPLHVACESNQIECVRLLLKANADVNAVDENYFTPLHVACAEGHAECACLLLSSGAMTNIYTEDGDTPLHVAVEEDFVDIVRLLVEDVSEVSLTAVNFQHETPLALACRLNRASCVRVLLEARSRAPDLDLTVPLHMACLHANDECVTMLLTAGASATEPCAYVVLDQSSVSPLHRACGSCTPIGVVVRDETREATLFARLEATLDARLDEMSFAMRDAGRAKRSASPNMDVETTERGRVSCIRALLCHGANVNAVAPYVGSALGVACQNGYAECVRELLAAGAMVETDGVSMAPLYAACIARNTECVRLLLDAGARIESQYFGMNALTLVCRDGVQAFVELLVEQSLRVGWNPSVEERGSSSSAPSCLTQLDAHGYAPLHYAIQNGHDDIARYLISKMTASELNIPCGRGDAALHLACTQRSVQLVMALVNAGADVNVAHTGDRATPLFVAAVNNDAACMEVLLRAGANAQLDTTLGETPLMVAAMMAATRPPLINHGAHIFDETMVHMSIDRTCVESWLF